jgi:hypothetical protein
LDTNNPQKIEKRIIEILEGEWWLPLLNKENRFSRQPDDYGGMGIKRGILSISRSSNGDMNLCIDGLKVDPLIFRNRGGGGKSLHTHKALQILALAIKLDQEEKPDPYK